MILEGFSNTNRFLPSRISGLVNWLDTARSNIIKDGSNNVSEWDDLSGNSNNVLQATTARMPVLDTSTLALDFYATSTERDMQASSVAALQFSLGFTFFIVYKINGTLKSNTIFSKGNLSGDPDYILQKNRAVTGDAKTSFYNGTAWVDSSVAGTNTGRLYTTLSWDLSNYRFYENGTLLDTIANATALQTSTENFALAVQGATTLANSLQGYMYEVILYNSALSTANRGFIDNYIKTKWSI